MICPEAEGGIPTRARFFSIPSRAKAEAAYFKELLNLGECLGNSIKFNHRLGLVGDWVCHVGILILFYQRKFLSVPRKNR